MGYAQKIQQIEGCRMVFRWSRWFTLTASDDGRAVLCKGFLLDFPVPQSARFCLSCVERPTVKGLPYFPLYVQDLLCDEDVACMSNEALGAYIRLLAHQWIEGSIPNDDKKLAKLSNCGRRWGHIRVTVTRLFSINEGNRLMNPRLKQEYDNAIEKSNIARENANKRWVKPDAPASVPHALGNAIQSQSHKKKEKERALSISDGEKEKQNQEENRAAKKILGPSAGFKTPAEILGRTEWKKDT